MPKPVHRRPTYQHQPFDPGRRAVNEIWLRDYSVDPNRGPVGCRIVATGQEPEGVFEVVIEGPAMQVLEASNGRVRLLVQNHAPKPRGS